MWKYALFVFFLYFINCIYNKKNILFGHNHNKNLGKKFFIIFTHLKYHRLLIILLLRYYAYVKYLAVPSLSIRWFFNIKNLL